MAIEKMKPSAADRDAAYSEDDLSLLYCTSSEDPVTPSGDDTATALALAPEQAIDQEPLKEKEMIAYEFGLEALFQPERLHPRVEFLIYWRNVEKSGLFFGAGLITLMAFSHYSTISLMSSLLLLALLGSFAVRAYTSMMHGANTSEEGGNPLKEYLELDLTLSQERVQHLTVGAVVRINHYAAHLKNLFLFENVFESFHFGFTLATLTIIGAAVNGMTLITFAFISVFTLPKFYETNKEAIDAKWEFMRLKWTQVTETIRYFADDNNVWPPPREAYQDK